MRNRCEMKCDQSNTDSAAVLYYIRELNMHKWSTEEIRKSMKANNKCESYSRRTIFAACKIVLASRTKRRVVSFPQAIKGSR